MERRYDKVEYIYGKEMNRLKRSKNDKKEKFRSINMLIVSDVNK
jgi:hypothetical protein